MSVLLPYVSMFYSPTDPSYTVSGARDHYREQSKANGLYVERVPDYSNFFSELPTHPSSSYRFKLNDKIPQHVPREYVEGARSTQEIADASRPHEVSGSNRYKYFRRPLLVPIAGLDLGGATATADASASLGMPGGVGDHYGKQSMADGHAAEVGARTDADIDGADSTANAAAAYLHGVGEMMGGLSRTVATQSDYRESETQTIAYEPEYVLPETMSLKQRVLDEKFNLNGLPETLIMKDLGIVTGLTPGVAEVEALERARAKRSFESRLPPLNDLSQMGVRQRMMNLWEHHEMEMRDDELKRLQEERLAILADALSRREESREAMAASRIEAKCEALIASKEKVFSAIQSRRVKAIRKLATKRARAHQSFNGREHSKNNIIENYNNFGSKVYAPLSRVGFCPDNSHNMNGLDMDTLGAGAAGNAITGSKETQTAAANRMLNQLNRSLKSMDNTLGTAGAFSSDADSLRGTGRMHAVSGSGSAKQRSALGAAVAGKHGLSREEQVVRSQIQYISGLLESSKTTAGGMRGRGNCWPHPLPAPRPGHAAGRAGEMLEGRTAEHDAVPTSRKADRRPETPSSFAPNRAADLERHRAVVLLQRLLRGRADQMDRYDGKERRRELIHELRIDTSHTDRSSVLARPEGLVLPDGMQTTSASAAAARAGEGADASATEALSIERVIAREMARMMRILSDPDPITRMESIGETMYLRMRLAAARRKQAAIRLQAAERGRRARAEARARRIAVEEAEGRKIESIVEKLLGSLLEGAATEAADLVLQDAEQLVLLQQQDDTVDEVDALIDGVLSLIVDEVAGDDGKNVFTEETLREQTEAAVRIQSIHRGRAARRKAEKMREQAALLASITAEDEAQLVKIQAGVRGYQQRKRMKQQKEKQRILAEQTEAAVRIQSVHRGRAARRKTEKMREQAALLASVSAEDEIKLVKIQAGVRGYQQRKRMKRERELRVLTDSISTEDEAKIVKLQAVTRGRIARREFKERQLAAGVAETESSASQAKTEKDPDALDEEIAVLKIQSAIRGKLARNEAEKRRQLKAQREAASSSA